MRPVPAQAKPGLGLRSVLENGAALTGILWLETLVGVLYFIVIVRLLGPEGYGLWNYTLTAYGMAISLLSLGFESVVHFAYGGTVRAGNRIARAALFWRLAFGLLAIPVFAGFALLAEPAAEVRLALWVAAPAIAGRGLALLIRNLFVSRQRMRHCFRYSMSFRLAELATGSALLLAGAPIAVLLMAHSAIWCLEAAWGLRLVRQSFGLRVRLPARESTLDILRRGAPRAGLAAMMAWLMGAPVLLFKAYGQDMVLLGQLAVALHAISLVVLSAQSFLAASVPILARSDREGDLRVARYGWSVAAAGGLLFAAIWLALSLFGAEIFTVVLGQDYVLASQLAVVACGIGALQLLPNGFQLVMLARELYLPGLLANLSACVVMTAGFILAGQGVGPFQVIWIACLAWALRAFLMILGARFVLRCRASL